MNWNQFYSIDLKFTVGVFTRFKDFNNQFIIINLS